MSTRNVVVLIAASLTVLFPNHWRGGPLVEAAAGRAGSLATAVLLCIVVPYTTLLILSGTYSPFLYFQF